MKCYSNDTENETDSEQDMTDDNLVWMTIGVHVNENKTRASDRKEDFNAIFQRMEVMSLKNRETKNKNNMEDGIRNRKKDEKDRKNERVRNNECHAEWNTKSEDSPVTYTFNKILTPTIYHSFLSNITCTTSTIKSTHRKGNTNNHHNQNKQNEIRREKNDCRTGVDTNEEEMHVISTYDEDLGSATPNRFWILVGTRPSAVLEIREYSGIEVLDPQFFINDVSFQIFNPSPSYKITPSRNYEKSGELSIERDTFYRIEKEKMKNILMWGKIISRTIENFYELKKSCDFFIQLKKENEVLVRHRDFIMTLQSSSISTYNSREIGYEKNRVRMNHGDTFERNELKKAIHIDNIENSGNENMELQKEKNNEKNENLKDHSSPTTSKDSSARTRTSDQRLIFTEELKLLIEQQCVRTMDFLSSLHLTVTQASSNICPISYLLIECL